MSCNLQYILTILVITIAVVNGLRLQSHSSFSLKGGLRSLHRRTDLACSSASLDSRELTKIFGRFAAKTILLDIPGAGTPEMASCCHGGCDNCNYSHVFDSLSAGRAKWVPTYSSRTLIDGRFEKAPWASIFDSSEELDRITFTEKIQQLPYNMSMGPGTSVPADETPLEGAVGDFFDILLASLVEGGEAESDRLTADQMAKALVKLTGQPHGAMWMEFRKPFHGS